MASKISNISKENIYDYIVIGGGASGLFFGASLELNGKKGIIVEAAGNLGQKILASGGGRCNFTHEGSIKDFPEHYFSAESKAASFVRPALYKFNNLSAIEFFEELGLPSYIQKDGRIFPCTNSALSLRNALVDRCKRMGWKFSTNSTALSVDNIDNCWIVRVNHGKILVAKKLIVATGSPAWKGLGRGEGMLELLAGMGIQVNPSIPVLTQIKIKNFNLKTLSGISFDEVYFRLSSKISGKLLYKKSGSLLITKNGFSGPLAINSSIQINKLKFDSKEDFSIEFILPHASLLSNYSFDGINSNLLNSIRKSTNLPERYIRQFTGDFSSQKASSVPGNIAKDIISNICRLRYNSENIISPSFDSAMSSLGGVSLNEVNKKSFQCNSLEGLYIIGEALDVTADTGGYNLQFAWSSAHTAAASLISHP